MLQLNVISSSPPAHNPQEPVGARTLRCEATCTGLGIWHQVCDPAPRLLCFLFCDGRRVPTYTGRRKQISTHEHSNLGTRHAWGTDATCHTKPWARPVTHGCHSLDPGMSEDRIGAISPWNRLFSMSLSKNIPQFQAEALPPGTTESDYIVGDGDIKLVPVQQNKAVRVDPNLL